jgi:Aldehyde dehydrogenase family
VTFTRDHLFIGGRWVEPEGGVAMPVINPATEEVIGSAPVASAKDAAGAVAAARQAFDEGPWGRTTPKQRGEYIRRLGEALQRQRAEIAGLVVDETGILAQSVYAIEVGSPIEWCFDMADRLLPVFPFRESVWPLRGPYDFELGELFARRHTPRAGRCRFVDNALQRSDVRELSEVSPCAGRWLHGLAQALAVHAAWHPGAWRPRPRGRISARRCQYHHRRNRRQY